MHEIFDLGSSAILTTLTAFGYRQGIVIATAHLLSVVEAGLFGICLVIITSVSKLLTQLSTPIVTLVSEYSGSSSLHSIRKMNNTYISISFGLALSFFAGIIAYSEVILMLFFDSSDWKLNDYQTSYISLVIMSGALAIGIPQIGSRSVLLGGGQHWVVTRAMFIGSLCSIVVAIISMKMFGLLGAALGWSTIWLLQGVLLYPPIIKKRLHQKYFNMLREGYLPGAYSGATVSIYLWIVSYWLDPSDLSQLIFSILLATLLGVGSLYLNLKYLVNR